MVKVNLQPHPNSIKVRQLYFHLLLVIAVIFAFFFFSVVIAFVLLIVGLAAIYMAIERFVKRFGRSRYETEIEDGFLYYNGEKIPIRQIKVQANPIEKRFGLLKLRLRKNCLKWIHVEDWKRYFGR